MADLTSGSVASTGTTSTTPTTSTQTVGQSLGKDDFLKLLAVQLQHQDPMNPMDDKDFMAQLAQFSSLEQLQNLSTTTDQVAQSNGVTQSIGLIGKTVSWTSADGLAHSGLVSGVSVNASGATLEVGSELVSPGDVAEVTG